MHKYPCPETDHIDAVLNELESEIVVLGDSDCEWATRIGHKREKESRRMKLSNELGYGGLGIQTDIDGAGAELALCRCLGVEWEASVNTFHLPDIGRNIQVRSSRYNTGKLIFRRKDKLEHIYVFVVGFLPKYRMAGFIEGKDCRRPEWFKEVNRMEGAWWIPQDQLVPFRDLRKVI